MSGSDRSLLTPAILGLVACSFGITGLLYLKGPDQPPSYPHYYDGPSKPDQGAGPTRNEAFQAPEKKQPCVDPPTRDESDLCAQWTAANAAEKAAYWAWWQLVLSAFGVVGLAATLGFNWITIRLALSGQKDAARMLGAAEANAAAARRASLNAGEANSIARETMQRQLRPHLFMVEVVGTDVYQPSQAAGKTYLATLNFRVQCFGETPAKGVILFARCFVGGVWNEPIKPKLGEAAPVPLGNIPPGEPSVTPPYTAYVTADQFREVDNADMSIFIEGQLQYTDSFGEEYWTNFRQACSGRDDRYKWKFRPCPDWNEAS